MVTSKNLSLSDLVLTIFRFKTFQKSFSSKLLISYNLVLLLLIAIISLFSNNYNSVGNYALFNNFGVFVFMLIGLPILISFFYGIFYVLFNAYDIKRKTFFQSYLVFLSILLPFIVIGNFLNLIDKILLIPEITLFFGFLLFVLSIWFLVIFINNFKYYYNTDGFKVSASILIVFALNIGFITLQYLTYLISKLN